MRQLGFMSYVQDSMFSTNIISPFVQELNACGNFNL